MTFLRNSLTSAAFAAFATTGSLASAQLPPAPVCPALGMDSDCGIIITVTDSGTVVQGTGEGPYDGADDTLIGVVNASSTPLRKLSLKSSASIFEFDGDGIDTFGAPGNGSDGTGYGGPNTFFPEIGSSQTGIVQFVVPLAPGESTYFSLENALGNVASCADIINNSVTPTAANTNMLAVFQPKVVSTLAEAADLCGFVLFDWQQTVTSLPQPSPFYQVGSKTPLTAPPPYLDPPLGGFHTLGGKVIAPTAFPFYYDPFTNDLAQFTVTSVLPQMLFFKDNPTDNCLPGGSGGDCGGKTAPTGSFLGFSTHLVGVNADRTPVDLGIGFDWKSTFNGTSGNTSVFRNDNAVDPGSGTGGVTITAVHATTNYSYNGFTVTAVNDVCATKPLLIAPPNMAASTCGNTATVSVGHATASDNCGSALTATAQVIDTNGVPFANPIPVVGGQVTLGLGQSTVRWTVTGSGGTVTANQTVIVGAAVQAAGTLLLDDRSSVKNVAGSLAPVANAGSGSTQVGNDARTGSIASAGPVTIQHRAVIGGDITSASSVTAASDATINGATHANAAVFLPDPPALPSFPAASGSLNVNSGTSASPAPGAYASASVNGTLLLAAGVYFFNSLTINAGATVRANPGTQIFVRDALVLNASIRAASGTALQPILLGFAGSNLSLGAAFDGTLVAPSASVVLAPGGNPTFVGAFFSKNLEVGPGVTLVCNAN